MQRQGLNRDDKIIALNNIPVRTLIVSAVSLVLGLITGWYAGRAHEKHNTTEVVEQMVETMESSDAAEAARDVWVIGSIESGETQRAVQSLCTPVATFYYKYKTYPVKSEQRLKLRAAIENLISTNKALASEITNHAADYGVKGAARERP